jgi:hypothetical protein
MIRHWSTAWSTATYAGDVKPGDLITANRKVWKVLEVCPTNPANWTSDETERDGYYRADRYETLRPHDILVIKDGQQYGLHTGWAVQVDIVPEHHPVCTICREPWPCLHHDAEYEGRRASERLDLMLSTLPGCCWACREPVTRRMSSIGFEGENLDVPGGPAVVFHMRRGCRHRAVEYEQRWAAQEPKHRRRSLSCDGHLSNHVDGPECTEPACPGSHADHGSIVNCHYGSETCLRCKDARARLAGESA